MIYTLKWVAGIALMGPIAAAVFGAYRFVRGRGVGWRATRAR
jgi:hypothetical protein